MNKIAIIGWGSLIWDKKEDFDINHGPWLQEGPELKLEFSRISSSRKGALTLVIDTINGVNTNVRYCMSKRKYIGDAIEDLIKREKTITKFIGVYDKDNELSNFKDKMTFSNISSWAVKKDFNYVIWTNLQSNFKEETGIDYSIENAIQYLSNLSKPGKAEAKKYISKSPDFIRTPLRDQINTGINLFE